MPGFVWIVNRHEHTAEVVPTTFHTVFLPKLERKDSVCHRPKTYHFHKHWLEGVRSVVVDDVDVYKSRVAKAPAHPRAAASKGAAVVKYTTPSKKARFPAKVPRYEAGSDQTLHNGTTRVPQGRKRRGAPHTRPEERHQ